MQKTRYIIGIDEVGRGPLAGPITVAAVLLTTDYKLQTKKHKIPLKDSKKLIPGQRKEWVKFIKKNKIPYAICSVSPKIIDKINISQAANLAASRALCKLTANYKLPTTNVKILLDGGLKINSNLKSKISNLKKKAIIKGDEKIPAISLASIVAKVHRDKLMERLAKKYPKYHFEKHKGYGTKLHYQKIKENGISKIHRKSFLK